MPRRSLAASLLVLFTLVVAGSAAPALAGGGCHGPDGSAYTEGSATVVRMDVCSFAPTVVRVPVGTTVRFLNTAPNDHAVAGRSQTWGSDMLAPGAEISERFDAAGVYPYACPLHPGMVGAVIVGDQAAAAAGDQAGSAVSANEPAPAAPSDTTPMSQTDATPVAVAAVAGLVGGAIIGLLVAALVAGRRRSTSTTTSIDRSEPGAVDG